MPEMITSEQDLKEPTFGQNDFRKPRVLTGPEVIIQSVLMVLFGKPGCYPSIPELGMEIQQYRLQRVDTLDLEDIKDQLSYQCGLLREGWVDNNIELYFTRAVGGQQVLLFVIPVTNEDERYNLVLGITEKDNETVYNYELVNDMLMLGNR